MSKTPVLTAVDVIRGLKKAGFVLYRQAKGTMKSGIILQPREGQQFQIIPVRIFPREL